MKLTKGDKVWYAFFILLFIFVVSLLSLSQWAWLIAAVAIMKYFTDKHWNF